MMFGHHRYLAKLSVRRQANAIVGDERYSAGAASGATGGAFTAGPCSGRSSIRMIAAMASEANQRRSNKIKVMRSDSVIEGTGCKRRRRRRKGRAVHQPFHQRAPGIDRVDTTSVYADERISKYCQIDSQNCSISATDQRHRSS